MNYKSFKNIRIIPRLDVKGPNLVKGIHLEGLRVLGKPEDFALLYYQEGADEIIYIDSVASLYGRDNLLKIVERTAKRIFIPLTAGGGVRTIDDIRSLLRVGADKVAVNTAAINNPEFITEAAKSFGSQCIVISIEAKKREDGAYEAYINNGRERTGIDVFKWAKQAAELGAGEIIITSIDKEGTGEGYDIELISKIADSVSIPVIACGGAGNKEHILKVIKETKINAVSSASIFHYNQLRDRDIDKQLDYKEEGNIDFLKSQNRFLKDKIAPISINEVKSYLKDNGVIIREIFENKIQDSELKENYCPVVAIIDYGLSNLFSIKKILEHFKAKAIITDQPQKIKEADGLILPGVGAFGDGIKGLKERGLIETIKSEALKGKPLFGICLGMQLLMTESEEFGKFQGLDLIKGKAVRLKEARNNEYKIPHIGWNRLYSLHKPGFWKSTPLEDIKEGSYFYFAHSYMAVPDDSSDILAITKYGDNNFCSAVKKGNIFACQFHPEKSGAEGIRYYENIIKIIKNYNYGKTNNK